MKLQLVGEIGIMTGKRATLTVTYLSDFRDETGAVPPPVLMFEKLPGAPWAAYPGGGPAVMLGGPNARVRAVYSVQQTGLPPLTRTLERVVTPNTEGGGYWDFTNPGTGPAGEPVPPANIEVLPGQGLQGEPGNGWLHGKGVPAQASGRGGDLYLDTLTWDVYSKISDAWVPEGNIKGGTGGPGDKGLPGKDGQGLPIPTTDQMGYVLMADGSQPSGCSWYPLSSISFAQLGGLDLSGLKDGQTLVYNAATELWRPGNAAAAAEATELQNGVAVPELGGAKDSLTLYKLTVPAGAAQLTVTASGGTGDVDIWLRREAPPTAEQMGNSSAQEGNAEQVQVSTPQAGTWYVGLYAYAAYSGVTLTATWGQGSTLAVNTNPDGSLSSDDQRITVNSDGSLGADDPLVTVNPDGSLSEV